MRIFKKTLEFQWNRGNIDKSFKKNKIRDKEAEEPFFDRKRKAFKDELHPKDKERYRMVGKTKKGRLLFIVFTMRGKKIRIISARDINKKEVYLYEEKA